MPFKNQHPLYTVWIGIRKRCFNPKSKAYGNYGARGITVCDRWKNSFAAFVQDMGPRPQGFTIERKNNNGPYSPDNCKWASRKEQMLNTRNTRTLIVEGVEYKACILAEISGLKTDSIMERAKKIISLDELLNPKKRVYHEGLRMSPNFGKTHCNHGHEYTPENTYRTPSGYRQCRICNKRRDSIRPKRYTACLVLIHVVRRNTLRRTGLEGVD